MQNEFYMLCAFVALSFWIYHVGYRAGCGHMIDAVKEIEHRHKGMHKILSNLDRKVECLTNQRMNAPARKGL